MRCAVMVLTVAAIAAAPVTLFVLLRPAPAPLERIVYIPLIDASSTCPATWKASHEN
jgi:hypothetical protein